MSATDNKWPPVDRYLIQKLSEWIEHETLEFKEGMTPQDCLVAMASKRGMVRVLTKLQVVCNSQREE